MKFISLENHPKHAIWNTTLANGDSFTPNFGLARVFRIVYTGAIEINNPIGAKPGVYGRIELISRANGSTVTFGSNYLEATPVAAAENFTDVLEGHAVSVLAETGRTLYAFAVTNQVQSAAATVVYDEVPYENVGAIAAVAPVTVSHITITNDDGSTKDVFTVPHTISSFTFTDNAVPMTADYTHGKWVIAVV